MPKINLLSPHVADLIAAGEVVERPASVVKELTENSIDAGAKNITIELSRGGLTFIRITDDGRGMSPDDAGVCFLRHATSKLKDECDLESIGTLGFRGEALAAIAAVSRIELTTRETGAATGVDMSVESGDIQQMHELACPRGTVMTVRDLFYNTPARLKFMKSDRAEGAQCVSVALKCALSHPEVSIRCLRDGKEEFFTPGDGQLLSVNYAVLGRETATNMLPCSTESDGISISGYISSPRGGRGNRAQQFFFVNGRCIRSLSLQTALENAYKNTLLVGKYPACTLHLSLSCSSVDVNVHPTKAEVKFSDEKKVFHAVYYAAISALGQESPSAEISLSSSTKRTFAPESVRDAPPVDPKTNYRVVSAKEYGDSFLSGGYSQGAEYKPEPKTLHPLNDCVPIAGGGGRPEGFVPTQASFMPSENRSKSPTIQPPPVTWPAPEAGAMPELPLYQPERPASQPEPSAAPETASAIADIQPDEGIWRVIGEAMTTYIMVERQDELIFIDKHAAHERIIFDRLKAQGISAMSQTLLEPIVFKPGGTVMLSILENLGEYEQLGFEVDEFGEDELIIRSIPESIDACEAAAALEELAGDISAGSRDSVLHTIACKAAIKAGRRSEAREWDAIAESVLRGDVKYCPHGRPVSFSLTKKELDKQFKRIV